MGQSRFMTPGVAPDARGVLLGRFGLLVFPTIEGVVSWFRLYSAESSVDELLADLAITRSRTPLRSQDLLVRIPAGSSYTMDRAARCARLVGGATYTGTSKHFVRYRDDRSPYGYDAVDIQALPEGADIMVHNHDYTQTYKREADIAFDNLLFRLSLRRVPGGGNLRDDERADLVLVVAAGLAEGVVRYLWRNRVQASVALVRAGSRSAFDDERGERLLMARASDLPARILELFMATPGIDVFRPVAPNVAVEVGFRHLIDLSSCASVFDADNFYLFWGRGDRVDTIAGPVELSDIEHLTRIDIDLDAPTEYGKHQLDQADPVGVEIRLAPSLAPPRHVVGSLIPNDKGAWLKKLVYALPQQTIRGHRVAVTDRGILLVANEEIDVVPIGQLLSELAPGLLVPLGMDLVPRVAPDVLGRTLGHGAGMLTVFPPDGTPFQVPESALLPLERRSIAKIEVDSAVAIPMGVDAAADPSVVNDPVGRFALWGFPEAGGSRKALPAPAPGEPPGGDSE